MNKYIAIIAVLVFCTAQLVCGTPLDEYVAAPDSSYRYNVVKTIDGIGYTAYVIDMISQSWRSSGEVDRTEWQHWLTIIKPDSVKYDTAILWINGGRNGGSAPDTADLILVGVALGAKAVVADLKMVPNQPLKFPDGGGPRYEDAIIAYTFDKYLTTGDANWPLLLPMVKSAVRAMDTVQSYIASVSEGKHKIEKFFVCGASKRGWTTWLTAAVDKRVRAICPAVIDVLNMGEQMKHHYKAYGFYAPAIHDYEDMKIFERLDTKRGKVLREFIDPYHYRRRYTMPKLMVNSTGDQFFLPDSSQFYFHELPGEKYLRYIPNTDHGLEAGVAANLLLFYKSIVAGAELPWFSWQVKEDDSIVVRAVTKPMEVNLWEASNTKARDFRLGTIGPAWESSALAADRDGIYIVRVAEPQEGWRGFFVELIFESGFGVPYNFTTEVHVVPRTLPGVR